MRFFYTAGAALGAGLLLFLFSPSTTGGPSVGEAAPGFSLTDLTGRTTDLAEYRGKIVLLDFWATWCTTCEQEVPQLKSLYSEFKDRDFALLAIACDEGGPEIVARFAAEYQLPYPVLFSDEKTVRDYRIFGLPTKYLIDAEGRIFRKYMVNTKHEEVAADIKKLLEGRVS